jgi:hypothetical protein
MRDRMEKGGKRIFSVADLDRYAAEAGFEVFPSHASQDPNIRALWVSLAGLSSTSILKTILRMEVEPQRLRWSKLEMSTSPVNKGERLCRCGSDNRWTRPAQW